MAKHISEPYKIYAWLNNVPGDHSQKYFYSTTEDLPPHGVKLNLLADMAMLHSIDPDDWIIFIDGDAFPINNVISYGAKILDQYPLLAVQRLENVRDLQPHPSFCLTTIGFWKKIRGDWKRGYKWMTDEGEYTDVGGNLLGILEKNNIDWYPLHRSNKYNLHPLFFGIYDNLIYHHGAGFRRPMSWSDRASNEYRKAINGFRKKMTNKQFSDLEKKFKIKNREIGEKIYQSILDDENFYQIFLNP